MNKFLDEIYSNHLVKVKWSFLTPRRRCMCFFVGTNEGIDAPSTAGGRGARAHSDRQFRFLSTAASHDAALPRTIRSILRRHPAIRTSSAIDITGAKEYCCIMIRKATIADVRTMQSLINTFADQGQMLPRSLNELYENLRDFSVFIEQEVIVGVCALHISWDGLAEVRSLAVRHDRKGTGIGSQLVQSCLSEARQLGADRVFVLTYQEDFFRKLGFSPVDKKDLPHKIWTDCLNCVKFPNCDESAMIISVAA
jgi:amino-acid N-acetyltransferase